MEERAERGDAVKGQRAGRWLLVVVSVAAAVWSLLGIRYLERLSPLTGDEPYYVLTAISLLEDFDLDEANQYAERAWLRFYPSQPLPADRRGWPVFPWQLPPHPARAARPGLYSKHGLGLTILIVLPWAVAGQVGAMATVGVFGILLLVQLFWLAREAGASPRLAALLALGLGLVMPIGPYALLLFPEVPAALCFVYAVRRASEPANRWWQWLLAGSAIGFLPWLHQRFLISAILLGAVLLGRAVVARAGRGWKADWPGALWGVVPALASGLGMLSFNLWLYGLPYQNPADHAGFHGLAGTVNGAFGLLLDAQWGLLVAAPVYLVALATLPWWAVRQPRRSWLTLAVVAPYLALVAAYRVWWGEWGPPARYLVPVAGFSVAPLASWLAIARPWQWLIAGLAWSWGALLSVVGYLDPQRFYHHPDGINKLYRALDSWLGTQLTERLVSFQPYAAAPVEDRLRAALLAVGALLALGVLAGSPGGRHLRILTGEQARRIG